MALWFRVQPNKKSSPRIAVERKHVIKDKKGRVSYAYETLGGITDRKSSEEIEEIIAKLDDEERYQFENYFKNRTFIKEHFNSDMDNIGDESVFLPPAFQAALFELWKQAKKHHIPFSPREIMLNALLTKAKTVERSLNTKLSKRVNILEKLGLIKPENK